jgi:hypothetical protein
VVSSGVAKFAFSGEAEEEREKVGRRVGGRKGENGHGQGGA